MISLGKIEGQDGRVVVMGGRRWQGFEDTLKLKVLGKVCGVGQMGFEKIVGMGRFKIVGMGRLG